MARKKITLKNDFKSNIDALNLLVHTMEQGDLTLEQSLDYFEQGVALTKTCQTLLQQAEQKIKILTQKNGEDILTDFKTSDA